jgi:hypothetical protein
MLFNKRKLVALTIVPLVAVITGVGYTGQAQARQAGSPDLLQIAKKPDTASPTPTTGRMFVIGRVFDPQGKPVANASVMVYARSIGLRIFDPAERAYPKELGRASSDSAGRFQADIPRTSSSSHDEFGAVALASGYGAGWVGSLDTDSDQPIADITLRSEQAVHGRLFDLQGQPAHNVKLSVTAIRRVVAKPPNELRENFEGPSFWWTHPDDLPGWPSPAISRADGRFDLHGVGPGLRVFLSVIDPRFTSQIIEINTDADSSTKSLSLALQPARTITGRVTYADTGKPVPRARVTVSGFDQFQLGVGARPIITATDDDGRFRASTGLGAEGVVAAFPPEGQPYLMNGKSIEWSKGEVKRSADLKLPRGVLLRGMVVETGSSRPISGAVVRFFPLRPTIDGLFARASHPAETAANGSFTLPVPARPGYLVANAPSDDYVLQQLDSALLRFGQPGGPRWYSHAFISCDPKSGSESQDAKEIQITLRPGATVKGRVVGTDGQPVADAWMISRIHLDRRFPAFRPWSGDYHGTARNGQFELHGLDPDSELPVSFLEPKRKLGATVGFSGKSAGAEPIVVKLEPCATATARLVGPDGKPLSSFTPRAPILMVVTPGEFSAIKAQKDGTLLADQGILSDIDPINYQKDPVSAADGRIVFPALSPGATYRIIDRTAGRTPNGPQLRKEFTVKPGETLDLGDILIERPPK